MWTRALLKTNAKQALRGNYWITVLVCFVGGLLGAGTASVNFNYNFGANEYGNILNDAGVFMNDGVVLAILTAFLIGALIGLAIAMLISAFLGGPVLVGMNRFFMENRLGKAPFGTLFSAFSGPYMNVVGALFVTRLFTALWSLLLIVPGIIKAYEWRMVPYLLAENPNMSGARARELSSRMMAGEKWNVFVLDLSFIGWELLAAVTVVGYVFLTPYMEATFAELYAAMRAKAFAQGLTDETELADFIRY